VLSRLRRFGMETLFGPLRIAAWRDCFHRLCRQIVLSHDYVVVFWAARCSVPESRSGSHVEYTHLFNDILPLRSIGVSEAQIQTMLVENRGGFSGTALT